MSGIVKLLLIFVLVLNFSGIAAAEDKKQGSKTEWGWPLPYEQVSQKSLDWLKSKGWLPLNIGYFADVPGYSACYAVIKEKKLLEKRGISANFISFLSGPPIVEAFLGGQTQVTHYGDFPFWLTIDKGAPAVAFALTGVNHGVAMLVAKDSAITKPEDLRQSGRQTVVGTTLGSYAEFYLTAMTDNKGLIRDKDFKVAGLSMREAQLLPKGVDAVVLWDPYIAFSQEKGLGRVIDYGFPYFFTTAFDFVRREIHENAPDVVQALADAAIEAILYAQYDLEGTADFYRKDPRISGYSREMVIDQVKKYLCTYPVSYRYIHSDFWATEDSRIIKTLYSIGRVNKVLSIAEMEQYMAPQYIGNTLRKLGQSIPERPVFLPSGWQGKVKEPPYPAYIIPVAQSKTRQKK